MKLIYLIFMLSLVLLIRCKSKANEDANDNKVKKEIDVLTNIKLDSLNRIIDDLRKENTLLKTDTIESHKLMTALLDLRIEYNRILDKILLINPKDNDFTNNLEFLKQETNNLKNRFNNLYEKKLEFKRLVEENNQLRNKLLISNNDKESIKTMIGNIWERKIFELGKSLNSEISTLRKELKQARDSMHLYNQDDSLNVRINELELRLQATENKLDSIPDATPFLQEFEVIPKSYPLKTKLKDGNKFYPHKNIDMVRVHIELKKIKPEAKPKTIFIQYIITPKDKSYSLSGTFSKKLIILDHKSIEFSDSIVIRPEEKINKDFKISDYKYPGATHTVKIYYRGCEFNKPQSKSFDTD